MCVCVLVRNGNHCIKRIIMTATTTAVAVASAAAAVMAATMASNGQKELKFRLKTHTKYTQACTDTQTHTHKIAAAAETKIMIHKATHAQIYTILDAATKMCIYGSRALFVLFRFALPRPLSLSHSQTHSFIHSIHLLTHSVYGVW